MFHVHFSLPPPITTTDTADRRPRGPDRPARRTITTTAVPGRRPPGRRLVAVAVVTAALVGGGAGAGVVALTRDPSPASTVVQPAASAGGDTSSAALNSSAVFAGVSPGVVEIAASGVNSSQSGPFGQGSTPSTATGSGFVSDGKGHIVTAAHVVDGAARSRSPNSRTAPPAPPRSPARTTPPTSRSSRSTPPG